MSKQEVLVSHPRDFRGRASESLSFQSFVAISFLILNKYVGT
jgi:hypothetical protein